MAFIDELGKKITQTGQGVVQKTKDATETIKINSIISDEKKKLESIFTAIGKMYFESHLESYEPMFENLFFEANKLQNSIAEHTEQIRVLKNNEHCPNCGNEVSNDSRFCNFCGTNLNFNYTQANEDNIQNIKLCPMCGEKLSSDNIFCTKCGFKLNRIFDNQNANTQKITNAITSESTDKFCPDCGKKISTTAIFCSGCGRKVKGE